MLWELLYGNLHFHVRPGPGAPPGVARVNLSRRTRGLVLPALLSPLEPTLQAVIDDARRDLLRVEGHAGYELVGKLSEPDAALGLGLGPLDLYGCLPLSFLVGNFRSVEVGEEEPAAGSDTLLLRPLHDLVEFLSHHVAAIPVWPDIGYRSNSAARKLLDLEINKHDLLSAQRFCELLLKQSVGKARNTNERAMTRMASKGGVPLVIPSEIWQPLAEVRAQ